ncbi:MAG: hypothetical protein ACJAQ6_002359 [Arenicella sp.]|jgi:hypothetical protein
MLYQELTLLLTVTSLSIVLFAAGAEVKKQA